MVDRLNASPRKNSSQNEKARGRRRSAIMESSATLARNLVKPGVKKATVRMGHKRDVAASGVLAKESLKSAANRVPLVEAKFPENLFELSGLSASHSRS